MSNRSSSRRDSVNQSLLTKAGEKQQKQNEKESSNLKAIKTKDSVQHPELNTMTENKSDFDSFREEIRFFFQKYDETLDKKLNKFDQKFTSMFDDMKKEISLMRTEVYDTKKELSEIKTKVDDFEKSLEYHAQTLEEKDDHHTDQLSKYKHEIDELKTKLLYQEKHDRRYNLLFYGFPEEENENLESTMKTFFKEKLKMQGDKVDAMVIANTHRLASEAPGPKPVIMKFSRMSDREIVFSKALHPILRKEKKRILSDLPVIMKRERGRLAKVAFDIRQSKKEQTRIVEYGLEVFLEVRKEKGQPWKRYEEANTETSDTE